MPKTPNPAATKAAPQSFAAYVDVDPSEVPSVKPNRASSESMDYYNAVVSTAPRDKVRRMIVAPDAVKGTANRLGRAIKRCNLSDVFVVQTGSAMVDGTEHHYVALRPKGK